jgi:hypothetical protein
MQKVTDLNRDEYCEYIVTTHAVTSDYNTTWFIFSILAVISAIAISVEGLTFTNGTLIVLGVCGLIFNYVQAVIKLVHIKKLFGLDRRMSFLK